MKKNKEFDCVVLKNAIQEKIIAETAGMNTNELMMYFNASCAKIPNDAPANTMQLIGGGGMIYAK